MKKNLYQSLITLFLLTSVITYGQTSSGKFASIKNKLDEIVLQKNNRLALPEYLRLVTETNTLIDLEIKEYKEIGPNVCYYGTLADLTNSSFRFVIADNDLGGIILDRSKQQAYTISTNAGNVYVMSTDINNVVCTQYESSPSALRVSAVPPSTSAIYKLQSNPASKSVAYLDFDGELVSGTLWANGDTINALPGNFTEADIQGIFDLVSEDYAAFNINITTDLSVYQAATKTSRMRCIFTPTNTASPGSGGVAYINSFAWGDGIPCWVFNSGVKAAGEAASHELGHTVGLSHDGRTTPKEDYFAGQGNWGPIMGASYSRSVVHWSIGEYNYANNKQDDLNIISTKNGFAYKTDDYGNTIATASTLVVETSGSVLAANNKGLIEKRTDLDIFKFVSVGGTVSFTANPATNHPNLDIKLDLMDAQGTVLATSNTSTLAASLSYTLAAGTYYLSIDGVGAGDPAATGYSDYCSIGVYSISGTIPITPPTNLTPNVTITSPASGAAFEAPASILITATAQDLDGTITKVEFYNGTTKLGEDLTSPYEYTWNNVAIGTYSITAKATDNQTAVTTSSIVSVVVKKAICKIAATQVVGDLIIGTKGSYNSSGYTKEFAFDQDSSTYFDSPNVSGSWVGLDMNGIYKITGIRYYPRISYGSRMNGGKFQGSNTADFSSGVVDLATISTTPVVEWNCITVTNTNSFKYVRYLSPNNSQGNVGEIEFYGTKVANLDPAVKITTPINKSTVIITQTVTVEVAANDPDGTITKVELYNDTLKLGEDLTSPYQFTVIMDASKKWKFVAKATDNVFEYTLSDTVFVSAKRPICKNNGAWVKTYTILGTTGSLNSSGNTRDKVFDKDSTTYFESPTASNSWVGLDLGSTKNITGVRFYPRLDYEKRMINGRFQIATNATFTQGVVNIDTILQVYNDEWNCIEFPKVYTNRYIRYLSSTSSYCNIAELQVYLQNVAPTASIVAPISTFNSIPASINLNVTAADADGTIKTVDLYENNVKIASLTLTNGAVTYNKTATTTGVYNYYVIVTDDAGVSTTSATVKVTVNSVTSLDDFLLSDEVVRVSPNPAQDNLSIQSKKEITNSVLIDAQGKEMQYYNDDSRELRIPEYIKNGLYNLCINFKDGEKKNFKLLIAR